MGREGAVLYPHAQIRGSIPTGMDAAPFFPYAACNDKERRPVMETEIPEVEVPLPYIIELEHRHLIDLLA